jgi:glutamate synthase (NADPH/NADH) small chain
MGKETGFLELDRHDRSYGDPKARLKHYKEFVVPLPEAELRGQASRCMNCGIPHCHTGCPVNNIIPDWNHLVYEDDFRSALEVLHSTNNFPEFTGRICPAPCQESCTLNLIDAPVTIKTIEQEIADKAWANGWIEIQSLREKTGKKIAVVGSGPAGMAAAQQLARAGHDVHLYEKHQRAGGLLRYGIPDFKMEKDLIDRRVKQMEQEGVTFHYGVNVGVDVKAKELASKHDALVLSGGSEKPRDLPVPGREFDGIHFAMDFLTQNNRRVSGENTDIKDPILATGKHVVVIGGGDTGSDCIGTSARHGAASITQLEILPMPPVREDKLMIWPDWPLKLRTSSSHEEGAERDFAVLTQSFAGKDGKVTGLNCVKVDEKFNPMPGTEFTLKADLVFLAMGFVHPIHEGMIQELGVGLDARGNVIANQTSYETSVPNVFVAGDMRRGQSLVVWAIREGRQAAASVDAFLMGSTVLPRV